MEGNVLEHLILTVRIYERDILENDFALHRTIRLELAVEERFACLLDDFHQPTIRDHTGRRIDDDTTQVADRPDKPDHQTNVGNVHAHRDFSIDRHGCGIDEPKQHLQTEHDIRKGPE